MKIYRKAVAIVAGFVLTEAILSPIQQEAILHEHLPEDPQPAGPPKLTYTVATTTTASSFWTGSNF